MARWCFSPIPADGAYQGLTQQVFGQARVPPGLSIGFFVVSSDPPQMIHGRSRAGKHGVHCTRAQLELPLHNGHDEGAHVPRGPQVPAVLQLMAPQSRPIGEDLAAGNLSTRDKRGACGAVVSALAAVQSG